MKQICPFLEMANTRLDKDKLLEYPSVIDKMNQLTNTQSNFIYQYLINGVEVIEFLSSEPDIVNPEIPVSTKVFTDGRYIWTMMIPHLVQTYKTTLPNEVLEHINKQKIFPNQKSEEEKRKILSKYNDLSPPIELCGFEN